jgi:hypothetical protein
MFVAGGGRFCLMDEGVICMVDPTIEQMMMVAFSQTDSYPKALANFIFRDIVEDVHAKYSISDEDMKEMCKKAVDRAALYITFARNPDPIYLKAFAVHAAGCTGWDDAEQTEDIEKQMDFMAECIKVLQHNGKSDMYPVSKKV